MRIEQTEITIDEIDYNELLELQKQSEALANSIDSTSGNIARLQKKQQALLDLEINVRDVIEKKRMEVQKRLNLADSTWKVDNATRKIIYIREE